ncbi:MAG: hypothetical protein WC875_02920 [Candidatus Absconditabacterales bacterium]|jgi:hypothetical protein
MENTIKLEGWPNYLSRDIIKNLSIELDNDIISSFGKLGITMMNVLPFDDALEIVHKNIAERHRTIPLSNIFVLTPVIAQYRWHIKEYGDKIVKILCPSDREVMARKRTAVHPYYFVGHKEKRETFKRFAQNSVIEQDQLFITQASDVHMHSYFFPKGLKILTESLSNVCNAFSHPQCSGSIVQYEKKLLDLNFIAIKHFLNDIIIWAEYECKQKKEDSDKKAVFKKKLDDIDCVILVGGEYIYTDRVHDNLVSLGLEKID